MTSKVTRGRYFACIVYPENISFDDMCAYLTSLHIPCAISPLHNPEEGKKQHYHVLMKYANVTTIKHVEALLEPLKGTKPIVVCDEVGYYRYLTHKDNPEKQQFDVEPTCLTGYLPPLLQDRSSELLVEFVSALPEIRNHAGCVLTFSYIVKYYADKSRFDMIRYFAAHATFIKLCL
jgi:hypothetical protein